MATQRCALEVALPLKTATWDVRPSRRSGISLAVEFMRRRTLGAIGLVVIVVMIVTAVFADPRAVRSVRNELSRSARAAQLEPLARHRRVRTRRSLALDLRRAHGAEDWTALPSLARQSEPCWA